MRTWNGYRSSLCVLVAVVLNGSIWLGQTHGQHPTNGPASTDSYSQFITLLQQGHDDTNREAETTDTNQQTRSGRALESIQESDSEVRIDLPIEPLTLADVIASVYRSYPEIVAARQQASLAGGDLMSAYGAYDTKVGAYSLSEALGFYENYRSGLSAARQTWWGGYVSAGYRIGRGSFQPWYKERETNKGGEMKIAVTQPLLQGRAIDAQRVAVFQRSLDRQAAEPIVQQAILESSGEAASLYWQWVASGAILEAQKELLALAEKRNEQFKAGVEAGKFAEIDLILNEQLIAERRAKQLEVERKFRAASFKLGVFLRSDSGQPLVPGDDWLPSFFPKMDPPPPLDLDNELAAALARRPEPQILQFELRKVRYDQRLACNELMPRIDLVAEASQDVGESLKSPDDKGDFQLVLGLQSEVPIQRRKARGKIQATAAKSAQINEKIRLVQNKISAELQTAHNDLLIYAQVVEQTELALRAALETLKRYRFAFSMGKIDLIYLNLLETKTNETEIKLVEAQRDWFAALSAMQLALGLDPLDQAVNISLLPPSNLPGPGHLPETPTDSPADLQEDWKLHSRQP
tara:strand:+ start:305612 stop:307348 length:1737 start_codon:yes stop_codon:yes gene_type:complete